VPASGEPPWRWLNHHKIVKALEQVGEPTRSLIEEALGELSTDPYQPYGVEVHVMHQPDGVERRIAFLPGDFILTYRIWLRSPPPLAGKSIGVLSLRQLSEFFDDLG
jgi:hypothetical protein